MMLFHSSCPAWDKRTGPVPRFELRPQEDIDLVLSVRTYKCERCGDQIHIDVDWKEGARVEPTATFG